MKARDIMSTNVITVQLVDTPVDEIASMLVKHRIGGAPVVENEILVGIISRLDIIRSLAVKDKGAE